MNRIVTGLMRFVPYAVRGEIKRVPGAAKFQRSVVSRTLDGTEFTHRVDNGPAKGIAFHISMPEDKGIWTGTYESAFAARLARAIQPASIAYDIGSWHGFFAGVMAAQRAAAVHVFEPLPENIERIRRLIALNPDKPINLHACAVGDRDTETDLLVMPETSMAKLETSSFQTQTISETRVRVSVRSIDSMIASGEAEPPSVIKIDVEGAERHVLEGARTTLRAFRPEIFAEIHSSKLLAECSELLQGEHYVVEPLDVACAKDVFQIRAAAA